MMDSKSGGKQVTSRHLVGSSANRDLWAAVRSGTVHEVDAALAVLKKTNGNIDARDRFGSTALQIATWRNHVPIVRRLLIAGADPDARDGESGWGSLHRALHFGHLAVAGALIEGGASLLLEDAKGRIPADLVSGPLKQAIASPCNQGAGATEVFSWGNGSNYQLGTGTAGIQRVPCRVEALQGLDVITIAAAKFHSVAVTSKGDIYSWGFGRGGRLGHEDYSGQVAVITPRKITSGLGGRCVKAVAAAKHHTIVATEGGEVYTWGTNREGQLGYPSVDTQSTPRRVSTLKAKVVAVAAANKHSAAITEAGEVFTWGCNKEGQLGYGTSNSASNCVPRCVESLKGKTSAAVSAAKYHTVVLADGEVFTWGYKMVTPRRVVVLRNTKKGGAVPLKFHLSERTRPLAVAIAAGVVHSTAISEEGLVFWWLSADPHLHAQQLLSMTGHQVVAVSAGKYRTAVATATGDIYAWDGESSVGDNIPIPLRIHGIKHVLGLAVGETHSLAVTGLYVPLYSPKLEPEVPVTLKATVEESDNDDDVENSHFEIQKAEAGAVRETPSLKDMCQKVIAETIIEPKNALQLLEFSESLGANELRRHCEDLILHNLGYILTVSATSFGLIRPSVFADLEKSWDACSSQPWSHRQLPVPSATLPAIVDSEEEEDEIHVSRIRKGHGHLSAPIMSVTGFLQDDTTGIDGSGKHVRAVRKKLQQIEALEWRLSKGQALDEQQMAKLHTKPLLLESLKTLELGKFQESDTGKVVPHTSFEKSENVPSIGERSKRQRNKSKKTHVHRTETESSNKPSTTDERSKEDIPGEALNVKQLTNPEAAPGSPITKPGVVHSFKASKVSKAPTQERVSKTSSKAKSKKGGLSLFLSGALDTPSAPEKVPVIVKADGPAWGGALVRKDSASLRNIQSEQKAESSSIKPEKVHKEGKAPALEKVPTEGTPRISLSQFARSSAPIAVTPPKTGNVAPPWVTTSPGSLPSLRDIQMQQVKQKERAFSSRGSPQTGSPLTSAVLGSGISSITPEPADSPSCWFKPDTTSPSSLRCIQIEEKAMKDLRRLYKNVKIVDRSF